ncbi:MAG: acyl-CoA dehydrogenase family protein [Candidatus Eisenbacteria bacterium]
MVRDMVRAFMESESAHRQGARRGEARSDRADPRRAAGAGLFGLLIPEEYGGAAISAACYSAVIEEMSKVCAALAIVLSVHNSVGAHPILLSGNGEEEKAREYLGCSPHHGIGLCRRGSIGRRERCSACAPAVPSRQLRP